MRKGAILVAADILGPGLLSDPEVQVPRKPRLPPEIVVLPFGPKGILFEGGKTTQVLTGASSRTLLPVVLEQIDGTKTLEEVAAAIPYASLEDIQNIVTLLFSCGVLENGLSPPPPEEFRDLDSFLGRFVDVTRNNENRGEAMARLHGASIAIAGSLRAAEMMAIQLAECSVQPRLVVNGGKEDLTDVQLLVAVATQERDDLVSLLATAHKSGVRVLHVRIGELQAQIGPLFIPGHTGCHECAGRLHAQPKGDANPLLLPLWLSMASLQVVHFLTRIADMRITGGFELYEQTPEAIVHHHRYVARLPGCRACGIAGSPLSRESPEMLAWLYHNSVGMPPRELGSRRAHQRHYLAQNIIETKRQAEPYRGGAVIALPRGEPIDNIAPWPTASSSQPTIGIDSIAALLKYAAGNEDIGNNASRRIAPTGGAMGSPELFVITHGIEGLPTGIYHYHAPRHVLERIRDEVPQETSAALGMPRWEWPCTIVGVGALQKLRSKYQNFAYRIVNLDAGIALRFLLEVARFLRIMTHEAFDIHDEVLARLIRLPRKDNRFVVTFALGLGGKAPSPALDITKLGIGILDTLISESALPRGVNQNPGDRESSCVNLLGVHLLNRRSQRLYGDRPVSKSTIQSVAKAASEGDVKRRSGSQVLPLRQWWIMRLGSAEFEAGIYEFETVSERLLCRGESPTEDDLRQCLNQNALAAAPAILVLTADLGAALRSRGARGYREVLLQAGTVCGSVLIAAESVGLGACTTAGIREDGFRRLTTCDGYNDCPMIAVTMGYSREP
jgi:SagB-type dehydrogenase family enzyme